jgi:uncharacterized membrane protein YhiD involved in acid resistance
MKRFLHTLLVLLAMSLVVYLGFVSPAIGICRGIFYVFVFVSAMLAFAFNCIPDKVADNMKEKDKTQQEVYEDYLKNESRFDLTNLLRFANAAFYIGLLSSTGYYNTAVVYFLVIIGFAFGKRTLKTHVTERLEKMKA